MTREGEPRVNYELIKSASMRMRSHLLQVVEQELLRLNAVCRAIVTGVKVGEATEAVRESCQMPSWSQSRNRGTDNCLMAPRSIRSNSGRSCFSFRLR